MDLQIKVVFKNINTQDAKPQHVELSHHAVEAWEIAEIL